MMFLLTDHSNVIEEEDATSMFVEETRAYIQLHHFHHVTLMHQVTLSGGQPLQRCVCERVSNMWYA